MDDDEEYIRNTLPGLQPSRSKWDPLSSKTEIFFALPIDTSPLYERVHTCLEKGVYLDLVCNGGRLELSACTVGNTSSPLRATTLSRTTDFRVNLWSIPTEWTLVQKAQAVVFLGARSRSPTPAITQNVRTRERSFSPVEPPAPEKKAGGSVVWGVVVLVVVLQAIYIALTIY